MVGKYKNKEHRDKNGSVVRRALAKFSSAAGTSIRQLPPFLACKDTALICTNPSHITLNKQIFKKIMKKRFTW